ncbi:MAG TPA: hypothetical protein VKB60_08540, partial [Terriglobales bacterium]|nr:hypothetical protein [Terriglobales bacterium]
MASSKPHSAPNKAAEIVLRAPGFIYRRAAQIRSTQATEPVELHCERAPLSSLAKQFGTPLYVYSAGAIRQRYREFDRAFRGFPHTVSYSV